MDKPSLRNIELPATARTTVSFWIGKDQYAIAADDLDSWGVLEFNPAARRFTRVGEFARHDGLYYEYTEKDGLSSRPQDWRRIVNSFI